MTESLLMAPGLPVVAPSGGQESVLQGVWVQDTAGNIWWLQTEVDEFDDTIFVYYDQPGGIIGSPIGDVSPVQDSNIQALRRGDDVNSNGVLVITFYRINVYDDDGAILASNPQTPSGGAYVILGDEIDPQDEIEGLLEKIKVENEGVNARIAGNFINFEWDEFEVTARISSGPAIGEIQTVEYKLSAVLAGTVTVTYDGNGDILGASRV